MGGICSIGDVKPSIDMWNESVGRKANGEVNTLYEKVFNFLMLQAIVVFIVKSGMLEPQSDLLKFFQKNRTVLFSHDPVLCFGNLPHQYCYLVGFEHVLAADNLKHIKNRNEFFFSTSNPSQ